jgi:hypothetical protein
MSKNKAIRIKNLIKSENVKMNKKFKVFISENSNENYLNFPKMKTIVNSSRNYDMNLNYYKNNSKSNKTIFNRTEQKYFLGDSNNIKYQLISKKIKKYNSNENIKKIKKENIEEYKDYSSMMKHLEKWDKEHCYTSKHKGDASLLYNNLINYYKNNNLINEEKNLNIIDNMLKTRDNFRYFLYNGYFNKNKLLKELIMRSPRKNNDVINDNNDIKINRDIINKEDDVFINLLNKKKEEKKNNDFYPNKVFKEKIKYEKELHQKLLFINNLLFNKKFIKEEKKKLLEKIYETKNKLMLDYNEKNTKDVKLYWIKYDEYDYKYKKKMQILNPDGNNQRAPRRKSVTFNKTNVASTQFKNMEFMKQSQINSLNMEMFRKQKKLKDEYIEKLKKINEEKDILENDIKIINNELGYYKHVNDELLREYKSYYMDILKKGVDIRKDGLLWVVKNLIELQINLEYQHFPKYLTHEQINYLKNLAFISLEENELKIIISVLKKRQSDEMINDNIERMNLVDTLMVDQDKDEANSSKNIIENNELTQKFYKIYKNNKKALKFTLDKNEEDIKIKNILIQIKKGLYSIGDSLNQKNNNFIKDNKNSILNAFMGKAKDKDLFSLILSIRKRLIDLETIKKIIIQKEKENYNDSLKFIGNNSYIDKTPVKELIKRSLFGVTRFEVE